MKEANLRKWHRQIGIGLAFFLVVQVATGLVLTIGDLQRLHSHAGEPLPSRQHAQDWALPSGHGEAGSGTDHSEPSSQASSITGLLMTIHHGGGVMGTAYRLVLGLAILVQIVLGVLIFAKMRARPNKPRRKKR